LLCVEIAGPAIDQTHLDAKQEYLAGIHLGHSEPMNIVILFFDDLGRGDLSSYGNELISTPYIDALAEEGLLMADFYSASPVYTPSRAAL